MAGDSRHRAESSPMGRKSLVYQRHQQPASADLPDGTTGKRHHSHQIRRRASLAAYTVPFRALGADCCGRCVRSSHVAAFLSGIHTHLPHWPRVRQPGRTSRPSRRRPWALMARELARRRRVGWRCQQEGFTRRRMSPRAISGFGFGRMGRTE